MDKDTKNEFKKINSEFENLAVMIKNGFDQTATDIEEAKEDLNSRINGVEQGLEGKIHEVKQDLEEKVDEVSTKLQDQKQVPLVRKVDEKLDKEIEIHGKNKILSEEDIEEIKNLSPFPAKPVITP
ncbi:MAG: hypothetical protein HQ538_00555 [Parcubacteria group bacterium]|nr:hypothetical protein [Parcubacteria group bacterium]